MCASEALDVEDVGIILGPIFYGVLTLIPEVFVERGGLEAVGQENHLLATPTRSLRFSCVHECLPEALPAMPLMNPDMVDFAAASPGVTIDSCNDFTCVVLNGTREEPAVDVARCFGIEFVDSIGQERFDLSAPRFIMELNGSETHGT